MTLGTLALLGSGETAPGMTKVHRELLQSLAEVRAANLNTPYGFQENVPQMTEKLRAYFDVSLHVDLRALDLRAFDEANDEQREAFRQGVRESSYVFAGPGSPTYALRQWLPLGLADDLRSVLQRGGVVSFASAAALTLGAFTPPIYEVYKVGEGLAWREGLNLTAALGLNCVVIPHYNNAEGSNYDTSRCYLGERRLRLLEAMLPSGTSVLGVDEHTAALLNLETRTLTVRGKGSVHWRDNGAVREFASGSSVGFDELGADAVALEPLIVAEEPVAPPVSSGPGVAELQLVAAIEAVRAAARADGRFDLADQLRDALGAYGVSSADGALKR